VARLVAEAGADADTVIAAVLHDTVEDTPTSLEEVKRLFGAQVAGTVAALTSPAAWDDLPLAEKKALQAAHIRRASAAARLVKLADQTANLTDMILPGTGWTTERMRVYRDGASAIAAECRGLSKALDAAFAAAAARIDIYLEANP
jgi:guanosine-3',5'-bis(diphosphate) 3'-pyrophosphohydrolase